MKNLLYKEFKLSLHPTTYIFPAMCLMMLIPNYPYYVQFMYICLSVFFIFLSGRENKDIYYSVLLPIRKRDMVKARILLISMIELTQILLSIPFAILSRKIYPNGENLAGIDINLALFGFIFMLFSVFNILFLPIFYRTAYKVGTAFLYSGSAVVLFYIIVEGLVWIPSPIQQFLDSTDPGIMIQQLPILLAGVIIWILSMFLVYKRAANNFEKVDL